MKFTMENSTEYSHMCGDCDRSFRTNWGFEQHQRTCHIRNNARSDSKDAQEVLNN